MTQSQPGGRRMGRWRRRAQADRPGRPGRAGPAVGRAADRGTGRQLRPGPGPGRRPARGSRDARRPRRRHRAQARRGQRPAGPHVRPDRRPDRRRPGRTASPARPTGSTPAPPWWNPGDDRCADAAERLRDWVDEVYRPVFGYLGAMLGDCWDRHPLCLAYLDVLHEAWCLLYLPTRDPKMVFAQLDWLTRPLLQAAEVMARETSGCRSAATASPASPPPPRSRPGSTATANPAPVHRQPGISISQVMQITVRTSRIRRGDRP